MRMPEGYIAFAFYRGHTGEIDWECNLCKNMPLTEKRCWELNTFATKRIKYIQTSK